MSKLSDRLYNILSDVNLLIEENIKLKNQILDLKIEIEGLQKEENGHNAIDSKDAVHQHKFLNNEIDILAKEVETCIDIVRKMR